MPDTPWTNTPWNIRMTLIALLSSVFCLPLSAQENKAGRQPDAKSVAGVWVIKHGEVAGDETAADRLPPRLTIEETEFVIPSGTGENFVISYEIDNSSSPARIDMTIAAGPAPESSARGIIAFEGDQLRLCYDPSGSKRPEKFDSTAENGFYYFVMEREGQAVNKDSLQGEWAFVSGTTGGNDVAAGILEAADVNISGDSITLPAGPQKFVFGFQLDTKKSPVTIDMDIREGPVPEGIALGIVKMDGDQFVLCYDPTGQNRPGTFESTEENGFFLFTLKRKKAPASKR